tara:strand:+ start:1760 stop:1903 length:144 start_codon:yes stop_codon:yes gene_type:complete
MGNLTDKAVYGAKAQTEGAHQKRVAKTRGKEAAKTQTIATNKARTKT